MIERIVGLLNKYGYVYLQGLWGTLWLSGLTVFLACFFGTFIALIKMSRFKPGQALASAYIELIRGTPILLQLYFFWLLLPKMLPMIKLSDTTCVIVALVVNSSAYVAEVIRAGIDAVDFGQTEAAYSLGMTRSHTFTRIILPQAIRNILPALGNEFITMIKETSLASVFFVPELTTSYKTVQSATYQGIPSLTIAGAIYLVLNFTLTRLLGLLEKKLHSNERSRK